MDESKAPTTGGRWAGVRWELGGSQASARGELGEFIRKGSTRLAPAQGKLLYGSRHRKASYRTGGAPAWIIPGSSLAPCHFRGHTADLTITPKKKNIPKAEQASKRTGAHMSVHRTSSLGATSLALMDTMSQLDATLTWPIWPHTAMVYGHGARPVRLRN